MLRKILKVFLIVISIGFIGVFVKGYKYQNNKTNNPTPNEIVEKQNIIEEETINSILSEDTDTTDVKKNNIM